MKSNKETKTKTKTRFFPKGRQLAGNEKSELYEIIGSGPYQRDLLIEYLHLIQDEHNCLREGHLHALAELLKISMAEVYEVATFYAHFDVIGDNDSPPASLTVRICNSISCMLAKSESLISDIESQKNENVRILSAPCMGRCDMAPVCEVGHRHVDHATPEKVRSIIKNKDYKPIIPNYIKLKTYLSQGGYDVLKACQTNKMSRVDVIKKLSASNLRGLGGAGFPTGQKWEYVRAEKKPRLMAVNADEGEPGTFKERYYLESNPHSFLEGMLIGAWVIEAEKVFIYLRDEYPAANKILQQEIIAITKAGLTCNTKIIMRRGAGAYICGEESAMIESIEGKRGLPRHRPPYVAQFGIFGQPTLVNNVETLYWVPQILKNEGDWFSPVEGDPGANFRSYSVSGRVKKPGVKLASAGTTARELIKKSGGMLNGHKFRGYLPGGASGGILPESLADLPLDFGELEKYGCLVGSHAVVIFSDKDSPKHIATNLLQFFEEESCGQCTPCRSGTEKAVKLMERDIWDKEALEDLAIVMADASICGLGQAAPNPLLCVLKYFPEDVGTS